jgi:uncharacterized protein DUF3455
MIGAMRALTFGLVVLLLAGCASRRAVPPPGSPPSLKVPPNEVLSLEAFASGVQIYECRARQWVFKAPEAELADRDGRKIGRHYAGPTWEAEDGSTVVGEVKARENARSADDIPWLLLGAKSASGSGRLGRTRSIQRMDTVGGKAPPESCRDGEESRVPYKATYYFYRLK